MDLAPESLVSRSTSAVSIAILRKALDAEEEQGGLTQHLLSSAQKIAKANDELAQQACRSCLDVYA